MGGFRRQSVNASTFIRPTTFVFQRDLGRRRNIEVKYYGRLDLAPFVCTEVTRSSFINVPATANQFMVVQRKYPSSVALWRTSASALMGRLALILWCAGKHGCHTFRIDVEG